MRIRGSRTYYRPLPPKMPPGLVELMEGLTKEVLKRSPSDIYGFCASHMEHLLEKRDGPCKIVYDVPAHKKTLSLREKIARAQQKVKQRADKHRQEIDEKLLQEQSNNSTNKETVEDLTLVVPHFANISVFDDVNLESNKDNLNLFPKEQNIKGLHELDVQEIGQEPGLGIYAQETGIIKITETISKELTENSNNINESKTNQDALPADSITIAEGADIHVGYIKCDESTDNEASATLATLLVPVANHIVGKADDMPSNGDHVINQEPTISRFVSEQNLMPNIDKEELNVSAMVNELDDTNKLISEENAFNTLPVDNIDNLESNINIIDINMESIQFEPKEPTIGLLSDKVENVEQLDNNMEQTALNLKESDINFNSGTNDLGQSQDSPLIDKVDTRDFHNPNTENIQVLDNSAELAISVYNINAIQQDNMPAIGSDSDMLQKNIEFMALVDIISVTDVPNIDIEYEKDQNTVENFRLDDSTVNDVNTELEPYLNANTTHVGNNLTTLMLENSKNDGQQFNNSFIPLAEIKDNVTCEDAYKIDKESTHHSEISSDSVKPNRHSQQNNGDNTTDSLANSRSVSTHGAVSSNDYNSKIGSSYINESAQNNNINNTNMDLETAAITIQKVFRTFLFKSRGTFDDTANNEAIYLDDDVKNKEECAFAIESALNKERRVHGITRTDTILQTVNEEKSLSLSTDDSSTLSSAATIIQAHVRGFLVRSRLNSNKTVSTNSFAACNSNEPSLASLEADSDQNKNKTILNIHIVPEGGDCLSRDESLINSMDLSLDSPTSSINLHPLSEDKSDRRRRLKREDAIQSISPPSNNSGKLSEDIDSVKEVAFIENAIIEDHIATDNNHLKDDVDSKDIIPENELILSGNKEVVDNKENNIDKPDIPLKNKIKSLSKMNSDERDVVTPFPSDDDTRLMHSGEFHDVVLPIPTKVSRSDTSIVREFKNVLVYFLLWNHS